MPPNTPLALKRSAGTRASHAFGFVEQHEEVAVHERKRRNEQRWDSGATESAQDLAKGRGVREQDHGEKAESASGRQRQPTLVTRGLQGIDQYHAEDE
jgi:hypothetical protein